jgi:chitin synthase
VYSEPKDQIDVTINTCIDNTDENKQLVAIICDGIDVNVQDNLTKVLHQSSEVYVSWKQKKNVLDVTYGFIKDTPCVIVKKRHNQGKKDTLIIGHDIFNVARTDMPLENVVLRESVRAQLSKLYGMETFDYMFCTDADSLIMKDSFNCLIDTIERRKAIACCGLVVIDFSESQWSFWNIYQNFQYLFGQYVRRGTENLYGKVSCLPGCITMFKIDELAAKAIAMYAQLPQEGEMLKSIVQLLGTDRRLTSSFLYQDKSVVTAYDPRAKCYTIPPAALTSYLSQRRRWGSNAYFNTMCNIVGPNIHPLMRVFSFMDYVRMSLAYFRVFNTILFVYSLTQGVVWTNILPFIIVMLFPTTFFMIRTLFDSFTRAMYPKIIIGYVFNKACSILITLMIISNMLYNIGSAKWGGNQKDASPLESKDPQQIVVEK